MACDVLPVAMFVFNMAYPRHHYKSHMHEIFYDFIFAKVCWLRLYFVFAAYWLSI